MSSWLARRPVATLSALPTWKSMGENAPWRAGQAPLAIAMVVTIMESAPRGDTDW